MNNHGLGSYQQIASEYYDPLRHPTCSNFREASCQIIGIELDHFRIPSPWLCDVGTGDSVLAELLHRRRAEISTLLLVDSSIAMLAYSRKWCVLGARPLCGDATHLPLRSNSIGLLVASLGDPYNDEGFWTEAARVVRRGGIVMFTTPSYDWASVYRETTGGGFCVSRFLLATGEEVDVASLIYPKERQVELIEVKGFVVKEVVDAPLSSLAGTISPKLSGFCRPEESIVTGYVAIRQ